MEFRQSEAILRSPGDSRAEEHRPTDAPPLEAADLQRILTAWQQATARLEQTHDLLRGEVGRLTDELEIKNRELARKNRLADLGQIASHVAHEVRNNLVPVTLYTSLLRRRLRDDAGGLEILAKVETGMTSLGATVNDLLSFAAERDPRLSRHSLRQLIHEVCESLAPQLDSQGVRVVVDVPAGLSLLADRDMLRRAVLNLALNALDAMPDGGELVITAVAGPHGVELEVADSGAGLSEEARRRAFEPFYTTKSTGAGLGLAVVVRMAEAHGGDVTARNCPEGGAAFTVRLPQAQWEAAA